MIFRHDDVSGKHNRGERPYIAHREGLAPHRKIDPDPGNSRYTRSFNFEEAEATSCAVLLVCT